MKLRRKRGQTGPIVIIGRSVGVFEIAPALMSAAVHRRHRNELCRANDIDPTVLAIVEAKDFLRRYEPVLDDPVERAADQLRRALGSHARRHPKLPANGTKSYALLKRFEVAAGEGDLCQVEFRHGRNLGIFALIRNGLAAQPNQCGKAEEAEEAGYVGNRRDEDR